MGRYRFELATDADDAELRRILAATPMPGKISLTFQREPSYFDAAVVDGTLRQVVVCREGDTKHIIGFGSRSVREMYVNGRPTPIGYLSTLRVLQQHRNMGLVARGLGHTASKLTGPGVDVDERCERTTLIRHRFIARLMPN